MIEVLLQKSADYNDTVSVRTTGPTYLRNTRIELTEGDTLLSFLLPRLMTNLIEYNMVADLGLGEMVADISPPMSPRARWSRQMSGTKAPEVRIRLILRDVQRFNSEHKDVLHRRITGEVLESHKLLADNMLIRIAPPEILLTIDSLD